MIQGESGYKSAVAARLATSISSQMNDYGVVDPIVAKQKWFNQNYTCKKTTETEHKITLFPHQDMVRYAFEEANAKKMLLVHRTGSGKTMTMASIASAFFEDVRPKILIFPTRGLQNNFYLELFRSPTRWRDFIVSRLNETDAGKAILRRTNNGMTRIRADDTELRRETLQMLTPIINCTGTMHICKIAARARLRHKILKATIKEQNKTRCVDMGCMRINNVEGMDGVRNLLNPDENQAENPNFNWEKTEDKYTDLTKRVFALTPMRKWPSSPLRSFSYSNLGSSFFTTLPIIRYNPFATPSADKALLWSQMQEQVGWASTDVKNPLQNKIIIMDEFHNLDNPSALRKDIQQFLHVAKVRIRTCRNSIVVGATATPYTIDALNEPIVSSLVIDPKRVYQTLQEKLRSSLETLIGVSKNAESNGAGYVSYFFPSNEQSPMFMNTLGSTTYRFPNVPSLDDPGQILEGVLPVRVIEVPLLGENMTKYLHVMNDSHKKLLAHVAPHTTIYNRPNARQHAEHESRMLLHCNSNYYSKSITSTIKAYDTVFEDKYVFDKSLAQHMQIHAKVAAIADSIVKNRCKTLVLVDRHAGFKGVAIGIEKMLTKHGITSTMIGKDEDTLRPEVTGVGTWNGATVDQKKALFNDPTNQFGERLMVIIADSSIFGEGEEFYTVRRMVLVNPPRNVSRFHQLLGRANRMCQFGLLKEADRTLQVDLYISTLPKSKRLIGNSYMLSELRSQLNTKGESLLEETLRLKSEVGINSDEFKSSHARLRRLMQKIVTKYNNIIDTWDTWINGFGEMRKYVAEMDIPAFEKKQQNVLFKKEKILDPYKTVDSIRLCRLMFQHAADRKLMQHLQDLAIDGDIWRDI
eukprot:jgi/Bigna1/129917/aug1.10_g4625